MRIGLFGGSFNPVHRMHVNIVKKVLSKRIVERVWIIPCKSHAFDKSLAPFNDRVRMLRLAFKDISARAVSARAVSVKIMTIESRFKGKSYTSLTLKRLKKAYPSHEFFFIAGADIISDFEKWHDPQYVAKNLKFIIVYRPGRPDPSRNPGKLHIAATIKNNDSLSSTYVRKMICKGISARKQVGRDVEEYINRKGLYRLVKNLRNVLSLG
jgi:nicotinate-nucleotide adenylyltransferase